VLSDTELAYAAGIFDGEGCLSLAHRGKRGSGYITPSLQVGNTNEPLLRWLQECFGGGVYHNKESRPTHRETWLWACHGKMAREAVRAVRPSLRVKARQADLILKMAPPAGKGRNGSQPLTDAERADRELAVQTMRDLNRRGRQLRMEPNAVP
jgi:hypothetical protein